MSNSKPNSRLGPNFIKSCFRESDSGANKIPEGESYKFFTFRELNLDGFESDLTQNTDIQVCVKAMNQ